MNIRTIAVAIGVLSLAGIVEGCSPAQSPSTPTQPGDQNGTNIVPSPIDYLSWTPRIAGFATDPGLLALRNRVLLIPAQMTPLARQQLAANRWQIQQGSQPWPRREIQ